jgi:hypothetical protein
MTVCRSLSTRLLLAASVASIMVVAGPALAAPFGGAYPIATAPLYVPRPPVRRRDPAFRRVAFLPDANGQSETAAEPSHNADVLPSPRDDADQPDIQLAPETAHYDYGPNGLGDDPTTFGLVAKF